MHSIEQFLQRGGGVARGRDLGAVGYPRYALSRLVSAGTILRFRARFFGAVCADPEVLDAAMHGGALTCLRSSSVRDLDGRRRRIATRGDGPQRTKASSRQLRLHRALLCGCDRVRIGAAQRPTRARVSLQRGGNVFAALESAMRQGKIGAQTRPAVRAKLPKVARWSADGVLQLQYEP